MIKEAEIVKIKRSQISLADYNPREITKENRKWRQVGTIPGAFSSDYPTQV